MIVMKFGGTSVEDAASIERVTEIVRARLTQKPVVVVSAMGKTTRKLLSAVEASAAGDSRTALGFLADLKTRHTSGVLLKPQMDTDKHRSKGVGRLKIRVHLCSSVVAFL